MFVRLTFNVIMLNFPPVVAAARMRERRGIIASGCGKLGCLVELGKWFLHTTYCWAGILRTSFTCNHKRRSRLVHGLGQEAEGGQVVSRSDTKRLFLWQRQVWSFAIRIINAWCTVQEELTETPSWRGIVWVF